MLHVKIIIKNLIKEVDNMAKKNRDFGKYEFNRNWITNHPVSTQNLLGMGMFEQTFHRLVGDFNDQVTYNNKKLEKIFNGRNLIMTHNHVYFSRHTIFCNHNADTCRITL